MPAQMIKPACRAWIISLLIGITLLAFSAKPQAAQDPSAEIAQALQPYIDRHELAGAVTAVVAKNGIVSIDAVGYSDVAKKIPMQKDAVFWIASMSKPIAATALMMLVDEGKVRLDDPVGRYLPDFSPEIITVSGDGADGAHVTVVAPEHPITVRRLLSHTSGLPFSSSIETPSLDSLPLATRVQSYAMERLMFEPGAHFSYSNAGINTIARIIERVSGLRYEEFLQAKLFKPLKMNDTTFWPNEAQVARLAKSYKPSAAGSDLEEISITQLHYPLSDHAHRYPMPAGGLFSTAQDLARFCEMLLNGGEFLGNRYVSKAGIEEMTRNQLTGTALADITQARGSPTDPDGYGLGWFTTADGAFSHGGAYSTNMRVDPRHGLALIWLVQHAGFPGDGSKSESAFESTAMKRFARRRSP